MRYVTPIVEFVSMSKTKSGDYYNYYMHVKDDGGYLTKLSMTQDAYERLEALAPELGAQIYCAVISFDKKYKRKSDGSDFWMHRELVTAVRFYDTSDYLAEALKSAVASLFPDKD